MARSKQITFVKQIGENSWFVVSYLVGFHELDISLENIRVKISTYVNATLKRIRPYCSHTGIAFWF